MYSLTGYGDMIADRVRVEAYAQALRQTIKPGSVVLEIGTGPGIFAVLACQLGARRVYAIEPSEVIQVAREIAAANGCADRVVFYEEMSTKVSLPEKADVIVSDLRGVLPLFQHHIPSIIDARTRLLAPGGVLIPKRDTIWAAIVETPESYGKIVGSWENNCLGQDLSPGRQLVVNQCVKLTGEPNQQLTVPQKWAVLDYQSIEQSNVQQELQWTVERVGTGHGIVAWFDAELADGVTFSNAPGAPGTIHGSLFFPWPQPLPLVPGQRVRVNVEATPVADAYVWRWRTFVESMEKPGETIFCFDQSELSAAVLSPKKLRKVASDYVPNLTDEGLLDQKILEHFDGKATLEEIARSLMKEFPNRFSRWQDALACAGTVSQKYSK